MIYWEYILNDIDKADKTTINNASYNSHEILILFYKNFDNEDPNNH